MTKNKFNIFNIVSFYVYWYLCILGPSRDSYYIGPIVALIYFSLHFIYVKNKLNNFKIFMMCGVLGIFFESVLYYSGFIHYRGILVDKFNIIPLWVVILWLGFGLTLLHSFRWILGKYTTSLILGGTITPLFYLSAHKINSIVLNYNLFHSYVILAILWAIIFLFINIMVTKNYVSN